MTQSTPLAGVSFKHDHLAAIREQRPDGLFFEVHAENYMGDGGPAHRALAAIRRDHPLSVHGVGMSIGGRGPLDARHLARLQALVARYEPMLVSEHLAWSSHEGTFFNDLLPLPYNAQTLATVCAHVDQVQDTLQRRILLENPSTYVAFSTSTMSEVDFLRAVATHTGCGLLLDINNVFVSACNQRRSAEAYLAAFPLEHVGQIHLAGHSEQRDDEDAPLLIDSHDRHVADPVWTLYADVIARTSGIPTLIEWDSALPAWPVLRAEAQRAATVMRGALGEVPAHA
ncbi:MNIO family bufferin maturase [Burkholderia sp. Ac-20379]|uniref:MNIO family bufferin maturase n=1 Tax=Burkholderia sp. Ac-20379 TaxID=2703900 RepID=UPI00197ECA21|nr:DUF692 domain-containing protein [Burkholderia sp. Ac-20379]MBN3724467.1 DUF692 domain-containing protein [Burkholderia sp. Ac-20379]